MIAMTTRPRTVLSHGRPHVSSLFDAVLSDWLDTPALPSPAPRAVSRPTLEVSEHADRYEVRAELPGAARDAITIDVDGARVSISTAAIGPESENKVGQTLIYSERRSSSFARTFELPQAVDSDAAKASYENGVLTLRLPKRDVPKPRRVAIQ